MSSEELACKLQRRLRLETRAETHQDSPQAAPCTAPAGHREPEPPAPAPTVSADSELNLKLSSRLNIHQGAVRSRRSKVFNPYTEFPEFSRRLLKDLERMFKTYDAGKDGFIDLMELKLMMEKLGAPQTHLGLKNMIQEVDEDFDGKLSFRFCSFSTRLLLESCRRTVGCWHWPSFLRSMSPWRVSEVPRTSSKPSETPRQSGRVIVVITAPSV
nr:EF-hand domain-containing protein D1 isoform X5 [Rattus norvegicus]